MVIFLVNAAGFFWKLHILLDLFSGDRTGCNSHGPKIWGKHQGTWHSRFLKHAIKYWFSKQLQVLQFDFRDIVMINLGRDFNHTWDKCILPDIHKYEPMLYLLHLLLAVVVVKLELMFSNSNWWVPSLSEDLEKVGIQKGKHGEGWALGAVQ